MANDNSYYTRWQRLLWETPLKQHDRLQRPAIRIGQLLDGIIRQFDNGQMNLRIMGLAYTTLLSLVPLLAVSFSVLKAFGVQEQIDPLIVEFLQPLGAQAEQIHERILSFVDSLQVGVLGSVGFAMLFYTAVSLLANIEQTFNTIWQVNSGRNLARRFSDYLSVILVGPVLVFTAIGLANTALGSQSIQDLTQIETLNMLLGWVRRLGYYLAISCAFAFLYGFLPNTRVRLGPALLGGLVAGVLWSTISRLFATFVATSSKYSAIYSGFAGAVLFVIWIYVNWTIIIIGAQIAAYAQNPRLLQPGSPGNMGNNRWRERLALELMTLIGGAHYHNQPFWTLDTLQARYQGFQSVAIGQLVGLLEDHRLIVASQDEPPGYLPARASDTIRLTAVLAVVRDGGKNVAALPAVAAVLNNMDMAIAQAVGEKTLRDLILESDFNHL